MPIGGAGVVPWETLSSEALGFVGVSWFVGIVGAVSTKESGKVWVAVARPSLTVRSAV
jgi:hypothetical protein